jgi:hypothetical protein
MVERRVRPHDFTRRHKERRKNYFEYRRHRGVLRILWIPLSELFMPGRPVGFP